MDYVAIDTSKYLEHHGILGQKWGVRRYQNKDGSLTDAGQKRYYKETSKALASVENRGKDSAKHPDIPKGYPLYRTSQNPKDTSSDYMYVTLGSNKVDRNFYSGQYAKNIKDRGSTGKIYEQTLIPNKNLKVASYDTVERIASSVAKKSDSKATSELRSGLTKNISDRVNRSVKQYGPLSAEDKAKLQKSVKASVDNILKESNTDQKRGEQATVVLGTSDYFRKKIFDAVKKEGYDAMVDYSSVGIRSKPQEGIDAIIVFNPDKNLSNTGAKELTNRKVAKNEKTWYNASLDDKRLRDNPQIQAARKQRAIQRGINAAMWLI